MRFLRTLKELTRLKSLARIDFDDGNSEVGFVVYADEETFDMYIMDNVYNEKIIDEDPESGSILLENEEDVKGLDFIFTKAAYLTDNIHSIVLDISHKFPVEKTAFFGTTQRGIYKNNELIQAIANGEQVTKQVFTNFPSCINGNSFKVVRKGDNNG